MKTLSIIILSVISSFIFSQADIVPKNGKVSIYYPVENGVKTTRATGLNKNNQPVGTWQFYTPTGLPDYTVDYQGTSVVRKTRIGNVVVIAEEHFTNDTLDGTQTYYNDQSQKIVQGYYTKGHLDSIMQFYPETGVMLSRYVFYEGIKLKKREEFFSSGELKSVRNYNKIGYLDGFCEEYDMNENGVYPVSKELYKDGLLNGTVIKGSKSGIQSEINYVNGRKHGVYKEYEKHPQLTYSIEYVNGIKAGKGIRYFSNGNISEEEYWSGEQGKYSEDVYDSCFVYWDNGSIRTKNYSKQVNEYQLDYLQIEFYPNENGKEGYAKVRENRNGINRTYDESGTLRREIPYNFGKINGKMTFWHANEKKQLELIVQNDTIISQTVWNESGKNIPVKSSQYSALAAPATHYNQLINLNHNKEHVVTGEEIQSTTVNDDSDQNGSYITYNKFAEFPGGWGKMNEFIDQVKRQPEVITSLRQIVIANVEYTVESDGTISQINLLPLSSYSYDFFFPLVEMEVKRIFSLMSFTPAIANGKNVAQTLGLSIRF